MPTIRLALLLLLAGCASGASPEPSSSPSFDPAGAVPVAVDGRLDGGPGGQSEGSAASQRRLIRSGSLHVVVDDYAPMQQALTARLDELGGFVADTDLSHHAGRVSTATLLLRVPADHFDELLAWTESQVEVQSLHVDTADVTERWVDTQARIDNGRRTERRLLGLLENKAARLEDVLAVERELARVRGEIESAEGQMRVLADQVGLATLSLQVSVRAHYEPEVALAYHARVGGAFTGSLSAMWNVALGFGIAAAALLPWLLLLVLLGWAAARIGRRILAPTAKNA